MNILLLVGRFEPQRDATSHIAFVLAHSLKRAGENVTVAGMCDSEEDVGEYFEEGIQVIRFCRSILVYRAKEKIASFLNKKAEGSFVFNRILFAVRHPVFAAALHLNYSHDYTHKGKFAAYKKQVQKMLKKRKYSAVVSFYADFNLCVAASDACVGIPFYPYQLDPWSFLDYGAEGTKESRIAQEVHLFEKSKHVFTTPILQEEYSKCETFSHVLKKISKVEFPNMVRLSKGENSANIDVNVGYTNILFCGTLEDDYRSPQCFLEAFEELLKKGHKLRLLCVGKIASPTLLEYTSKYPRNIQIYKHAPYAQIEYLMNECDFLLNINNTLATQVPSKLLNYFASGKPVINIQKIASCPARVYANKYPLCFTMEEYGKADICELEDFILRQKGKQISFDVVKDIFEEARPEYVAGLMLGQMKEDFAKAGI